MKGKIIIVGSTTLSFGLFALALMALYVLGIIGQEDAWILAGMISVGLFLVGCVALLGLAIALVVKDNNLKIPY